MFNTNDSLSRVFFLNFFLVQRVEPVSRIRERRCHFVPYASFPSRVRIQRVLADGCCFSHSMQRRKDTAIGSAIETLAGDYKRRALLNRCGGSEFPGFRTRLRGFAYEKEHRLSRRVQRRGASLCVSKK